MKKLIHKFRPMVEKMVTFKTLGTPHQYVKRPEMTKEEQKIYRSGVSTLLYLVKHSRPDIANAVRELSKVMDNPTPYSMKELKHIIKYSIDTKDYGLKIHLKELRADGLFEVILYSDSD